MGGGAGAYALNHPVILPPDAASLNLTIGTGGVGGQTTGSGGGDGGGTRLFITGTGGNPLLSLNGGKGGTSTLSDANAGAGGSPLVYGLIPHIFRYGSPLTSANVTPKNVQGALETAYNAIIPTVSYGIGARKVLGNVTHSIVSSTVAAGGPFGGSTATAAVMTIARDGYGVGGKEAATNTVGNPGGPGILIIEFIEGLR